MAPASNKPKFSPHNPFAPDVLDRNRIAVNIVRCIVVAAIGAGLALAADASNGIKAAAVASRWERAAPPAVGALLALAVAEFFAPTIITYWLMCVMPPLALVLPGGRMYFMQLEAREWQTKLAIEWEKQTPEERMATRKANENWGKK